MCDDDIGSPLEPPVRGVVHLWWASLAEATETSADVPARLVSWISLSERRRVDRLRDPETRARRAASRGLLRWLLSRYVGTAPRALRLLENPAGKPMLIDPESILQFNVSHTGDLWVCAVAAGQPVGVDVERIRPLSPRHVMPFLALEERAAWAASFGPVSGAEGVAALFALWTRKEAYIKARGLGLHLPLDAFAVTVDPDLPPRLQYDRRDPQAPTRWCLTDLDDFPGVRGALAMAGPLRSVRLRAVRIGSRARSVDEPVGVHTPMALS